jgi:hypothetical protein
MRAKPFVTPMRRGRLPACSCRHESVDARRHRPAGHGRALALDSPTSRAVPACAVEFAGRIASVATSPVGGLWRTTWPPSRARSRYSWTAHRARC